MWTLANPLVKWAIGAIVLVGIFLGGVFFEYEHTYLPYKATVTATAQVQAQLVKNLNKEIDTNAKQAEANVNAAAASVDAYYKSHPVVVVRVANGVCTVSKATGDTNSIDETGATSYVSPYSAPLSEQLASQLNELQKLLKANGVTVK